ncbi:hypothetical protein TNCV_979941 [Trichonephila clavipes]|uniref:Uncharacterized protein n=1 Tax=Trichonephila clavipes TaxID=2585209 RepID=A0A8X6V893_TRICX|nr:hypothetical protein TNCV_979941 [Trichonephila clavipes]
MQMTVRICSVPPQFRGRTPWRWSGTSHLSSLSTHLTRGLVARRLFRVPPCRESTIHLQTSMPSLGFKSRPYPTAVSVTNSYTGWMARVQLKNIETPRHEGFNLTYSKKSNKFSIRTVCPHFSEDKNIEPGSKLTRKKSLGRFSTQMKINPYRSELDWI